MTSLSRVLETQLTDAIVHRKLESKESQLEEHPLIGAPDVGDRMGRLMTKQGLQAQAKALQKEVKAAQGTVLSSELKARHRVLRRLGWVCSLVVWG